MAGSLLLVESFGVSSISLALLMMNKVAGMLYDR